MTAVRYEIRVRGVLDRRWSGWFDSNAKAKAELGWHPASSTYHEGIQAMVSPP